MNVGHINISSVQELCPLTLPEEISLAELDAISNSGVSFSRYNMFELTPIDCGLICLCYECHHGDDKGMSLSHNT